MRVCRVRWPDYWRRRVAPLGRSCKTLTRNPLADLGDSGVNNGASFAIVLGAARRLFLRRWNSFSWHLAARLSHR